MKRFFIVDVNEEGIALGFATDNLHKDFILEYEITWSEGGDTDVFGPPIVEDLEVGRGNRMIHIFDMTQGPMRPGIDIKSCIGEFNFFTEDFYDGLTDFIQENWNLIERGIDESNSVKKFKDFN